MNMLQTWRVGLLTPPYGSQRCNVAETGSVVICLASDMAAAWCIAFPQASVWLATAALIQPGDVSLIVDICSIADGVAAMAAAELPARTCHCQLRFLLAAVAAPPFPARNLLSSVCSCSSVSLSTSEHDGRCRLSCI